QVGEIIPNLVAVRAGTASQETIPLTGDLPTVIYSFTSVCGWCSSNIDNIRHLASSLAGRYRVIGVSLGPEDPVWSARTRAALKDSPVAPPVSVWAMRSRCAT